MPILEVHIAGMEAFARRIEAMAQAKAEVMRAAASAMKTDVLLHFRDQAGPAGPWEPSFRAKTTGGQTLRWRSNLRHAVAEKSTETSASVGVLKTGPAARYAAVHQFGAVIVPTQGKCLAIPWSKQAERAGRPRNMPNLKLVWPKGAASGWLVEHKPGRGKGGYRERDILHWRLVRKVTVPARPYLWLSAAGKKEVANRVGKILRRVTGGD